MTTRIRFFGVAAYEVRGPRFSFVIDPFLTGNPAAPVGPEQLDPPDFVLVTHAASDHVGDAVAIARRFGAPVICGADVRALLLAEGVDPSQVRATVWGIQVAIAGAVVKPVESHHWSQALLPDGTVVSGVPMGFVVETEPGVTIYHGGDTAVFGDLRLIGELHAPTVGLIGCAQPRALVAPGPGKVISGEMSPRDAALAVELLGVRLAVASHYLEVDDPDVVTFRELVSATGRSTPVVLSAGQTLVIDGGRHWVE